MKRERPPMPPLAVRIAVAETQYFGCTIPGTPREGGPRLWLEFLLCRLGNGQPMQLDHDPALILRPYNPRKKDVAARYTPHAHDPDSLIYRSKADHQRKTTGRRPGAERTITTKGSDIGLKAKFARLERRNVDTSDIPEAKKGWFKKAKLKMPSRPFPKRRGFSKP